MNEKKVAKEEEEGSLKAAVHAVLRPCRDDDEVDELLNAAVQNKTITEEKGEGEG